MAEQLTLFMSTFALMSRFQTSTFRSKMYNRYLRLVEKAETNKFARKTSSFIYKTWLRDFSGLLSTTIHGHDVVMPAAYAYPVTLRKVRTFNDPLLELVILVSRMKERKVNIADVGAAIGDTPLFLKSNAPGEAGEIFCIDGDEEFFDYLKENVSVYKDVYPFKALLTDNHETQASSLIRTHASTASAQGNELKDAISLDKLLSTSLESKTLDVLKTDVDGFDGKVLNGAHNILTNHQPHVIFEWHPILYNQTSNDPFLPFEVLNKYGYRNFVWFNKYGRFSHFEYDVQKENIEKTISLCMNNQYDYDWHYDVVALPESSNINEVELAECRHAKNKISRW